LRLLQNQLIQEKSARLWKEALPLLKQNAPQ